MMRCCGFFAVGFLALGVVSATPSPYADAVAFEPSSRPSDVQLAANDSCRAILTARNTTPSLQKAVLKTRDTASSAAIGLIFGVRTAIGPRENPVLQANYRASGIDSERARATALYRHCINQKRIESLAQN